MPKFKSNKSKPSKLKIHFVDCPDCGRKYAQGMPHVMFCPAHTCEECGTSFSRVIEKNREGRRVCEECNGWEES